MEEENGGKLTLDIPASSAPFGDRCAHAATASSRARAGSAGAGAGAAGGFGFEFGWHWGEE